MNTKNQSRLTIGKRLAIARKAADITTNRLGEITGYSGATFRSVERNHTLPSLRLLVAVSGALNVDLLWLKSGQGEMKSDQAGQLSSRAENLLHALEAQAQGAPLDASSPLARAIADLRAVVLSMSEYKADLERAKCNILPPQPRREVRPVKETA